MLPIARITPSTASVPLGGATTFTVTGQNPPFTYQWSRDSSAISDATTASLTISNVTDFSGGLYMVDVSNSYGDVTLSAYLSVDSKTDNGSTLTSISPAGYRFTETYTTLLDSSTALPVGVRRSYNF